MKNTPDSKQIKPDPLAHIQALNLLDAFENLPPPLDFVLPGMLSGTVGSLVAQGGAGKSWLALQIATAIAGGPDLAGFGVPAVGKVVYLPAEDPASAIAHRLHALGQHLDDEARQSIHQRLTVLPLMGLMVNLALQEWAEAIERRADGARLIVIDTLRRFHIEDENNGGAMTLILGILEGICQRTGASVLFLHHTAKGAALNGGAAEQQASRGSSVLVDNIRGGQWNLMRMSETEAGRFKIDSGSRSSFVKVVQAKANFGPPLPDKWLERTPGGVLTPALSLEIADDVRNAGAAQTVIPYAPQNRRRGEDG